MTPVEMKKRMGQLMRYDGDNNDHHPDEDFGWFLQRDEVYAILDEAIAAMPVEVERKGFKIIGMTAEQFKMITGREPEQDDLERVNCPNAGTLHHQMCGVCPHGRPRFDVGLTCRCADAPTAE